MVLNREEYENKIAQDMEQIVQEMSEFLAEGIRFTAKMRKQPISPRKEDGAEYIQSLSMPEQGRSSEEVAQELFANVFDNALLVQHPRFFSFVPAAVSPYSLMGTIMTDIYNLHGGGWAEAPGACAVEEKLIQWMGSLAGYDEKECGGVFLSGGSIGNMSAIIAARENKLEENEYYISTAYISDQTHSSVEKNLRLLGLRRDQIVKIPTDDDFRMRVDLLENAIQSDIEAGKKPFIVIGTMGTTNTGTIDPLDKIGKIAKKYNMWFHVDGAFGGSMLLSRDYRAFFRGIELSDSLTWDTHKWLMQTYSCSCLIAKNKQHLLNAFTEHPEYLADVTDQSHNDPWDLGPEMTRPHRAIKLWCTVQIMGTEMLSYVVDYSINNAIIAFEELIRHPDWEIVSKPSCGTLNFRYSPAGYSSEELDRLNSAISKAIIDSGYAYIVTTVLKGKKVLRICAINANTTAEDVRSTIIKLNDIATSMVAE